jgi:polysaccharide export outer membrane protein
LVFLGNRLVNIMRRIALAVCITGMVSLAGCANPVYRTDVFRAQLTAPYTLASGDRIRIIVFGQDALSNSFAVNGSGMISMPLIGNVSVVGMTTDEAERTIESRLRAGFLREPHVSIEVEAYRPFFVLGEVTTAGQYPFINGMTVQKAIAVAGGFTARADRNSADITRMINGTQITARVPLAYPLRPGDTVTIEERFF